MAFNPKSRISEDDLEHVIIANSATIALGECVITDGDGFISNGAAAGPLLGVVVGFDSASTPALSPTEYVAGTATTTDVTSVVAAGDNETSAKKRAIVCTSRTIKYSAAVNGTIGSTNDSDQFGGMIDCDSATSNYSRVLESTMTRTAGTATNFFSYGPDPEAPTRLIVSVACSELVVEQS